MTPRKSLGFWHTFNKVGRKLRPFTFVERTPVAENTSARIARELHDGLVARLGRLSGKARINVSGEGVHWHCTAACGQRSCLVHCGTTISEEEPDFLTYFQQDGKKVAAGRTSSKSECIEAVWHWLDGTELDAMYGQFGFVDLQKRGLVRIRNFVLENVPCLSLAASCEIAGSGEGFYQLRFRTETRSAELGYSRSGFGVAFYWDQCKLFHLMSNDWSVLGAVLKRWLCGNAMPSTMRKEFPWLKIGPLADYYENGNPVEGEFILGWDEIGQYFDHLCDSPFGKRFLPKSLVSQFIADLRRAGYDRKLRAGASVWRFVLSRSRRYGLRDEQPFISFVFRREGTLEIRSKIQEGGEIELIAGAPIALCGQVKEVLDRLVNQPIT